MKKNKLPTVFYKEICPLDKNGAYLEEILQHGICQKSYQDLKKGIKQILASKVDPKKLGYFKENYLLHQKIKDFSSFFKKTIGHEPFRFQLYFAKKIFNRESFSITAPTGIGKTTFGIAIAHFLEGKVYYLVPSKILLNEIEKKLNSIVSKKKILVIKKTEDKEKLLNNNFDILVTTSNFLHKNFEILPKNFDLIFIDDADSLIRQPKNIDKILNLVGFSEKEIEKALNIIDQKRKAKNKEDYNSISKLNIDLSNKGIIVASSATLTPKTKRIALFRELLGFEIGYASSSLRNIEEVYEEIETKNENIKEKLFEKAVDWIQKLGYGGFVFLSDDFSKDDLNYFVNFLNKNGISSASYEKFNKVREDFISNKIQVIVGFSNIRNPLTRGIDLPQTIRYTLFVGVPKFKIPLSASYSPMQLFLLSLNLREILNEEERNIIENNLKFLRKISFLKEEDVLHNENLKKRLEPIREIFKKLLSRKDLIQEIDKHPELSLEKNNKGIFLLLSDPRGYIQASGRCSRLFPLGLTKGLSLILAENLKVLRHLKEKLKILGYDINFQKPEEVNWNLCFKKIDQDRELVMKVLEGNEFVFKDPIETILVIVESPTKSKTIANFFGRPTRKFIKGVNFYEVSMGNRNLIITSTMGHFVDLSHEKRYFGVEVSNTDKFVPIFQPLKICLYCKRNLDDKEKICPICKNKNFLDKRDLIQILQEIAFQVDKIYISSDPDSEGEKIAFDLYSYLLPYNQNIKRIELHEITRKEFLKKIEEPREINHNLVKAQLLRRISDRWIGFKLSGEIQNHFENLNLSAGRVQTPVLGWILEKEQKVKEKHYLILPYFNINDDQEELNYISFYTEDKNIVSDLKEKFKNDNLEIKIKFLEKKEININPLPPYETGSILKEASMFFKLDSRTTMKILQDLFEQGLITYHRTDSIHVSSYGQMVAKNYLEKYHLENLFSPRSWGKQGTHEAIRPTKPLDVGELIDNMIENGQQILTKKHFQIYGLIVNRFVASQMQSSKVLKGKIKIKLGSLSKEESVYLEILENNHLRFFRNVKILNLKEGTFKIKKLLTRKVSKEFRFTYGEIVDLMKKKKLGRPSTYATIIQTLLERKYIIARSNFLIPTTWGEKIFNYLKNYHPDLISEEFTVKLEKNMDKIEKGRGDYQEILKILFRRIFQ